MPGASHQRVRALILRANAANSRDRYIHFCSSELGLQEAYVRGALAPKNPLSAATEAFSYSELELFKGKSKYYVDQANYIYAFTKLKSNIEALGCAAHLGELAQDLCQGEEELEPVHELLLRAFYALESASKAGPMRHSWARCLLLSHVAELRLLSQGGYRPDLDKARFAQQAPAAFDFQHLRFLDEAETQQAEAVQTQYQGAQLARRYARYPQQAGRVPQGQYYQSPVLRLSPACYQALQHCFEAPLERLFAFRAEGDLAQGLGTFASRYLAEVSEKSYHRLDYVQSLVELQSELRPRDRRGGAE